MLGMWKRVASNFQPWGWSQTTSHTPPLRSVRSRRAHQQAHHVVSQSAVTISLVSDIFLRQYHQVESTVMCRPYCLFKPVSLAIADVKFPKGYSPGARRPLEVVVVVPCVGSPDYGL